MPSRGNGDPGLQPQRTVLAWNRTAIAVFVNAVLVLRAGAHCGHETHTMLFLAGWLLLLGAGAMFVCGQWRGSQLLRGNSPTAPSQAVMIGALLVAGLACAVGAAAVFQSSDAAATSRTHGGAAYRPRTGRPP